VEVTVIVEDVDVSGSETPHCPDNMIQLVNIGLARPQRSTGQHLRKHAACVVPAEAGARIGCRHRGVGV